MPLTVARRFNNRQLIKRNGAKHF